MTTTEADLELNNCCCYGRGWWLWIQDLTIIGKSSSIAYTFAFYTPTHYHYCRLEVLFQYWRRRDWTSYFLLATCYVHELHAWLYEHHPQGCKAGKASAEDNNKSEPTLHVSIFTTRALQPPVNKTFDPCPDDVFVALVSRAAALPAPCVFCSSMVSFIPPLCFWRLNDLVRPN